MLLRAILLLLAMGVMHVTMAQRPEVTDLVCEYLVNPVGIDATQPRLSWKIRSGARDVMQSAYEIRVGTDPGVSRGRNIVWTSGKVASSQSTHVRYGGPAFSRANGCTGRSESGTVTTEHPPGAHLLSGKWDYFRPPTGPRNGYDRSLIIRKPNSDLLPSCARALV